MSYVVSEHALEAERVRHRHLAHISDPETIRIFDEVGLSAGWRCLEVGMGGGSIAKHLAERVGAKGEVLATDIDMRLVDVFVPEPPPQLTLKKHDILKDALPEAYYDLAHARALLEHLPDPEQGVMNMRRALRPGGWLVAESGDFTIFDSQEIGGAFGEMIRAMRDLRTGAADEHHAQLGLRMLSVFREAGMENIHTRGHVWQMRANEPSLEWLLLALETGMKGVLDDALLEAALAEGRSDGFMALSPLHISTWAQAPT